MTDMEVPNWLLGVLVTTIGALAGVVAYLFKLYNRRVTSTEKTLRDKDRDMAEERATFATERASWSTQRETMRAELEEKLRVEADNYASLLLRDRDANREHEDAMRTEFAELMEGISAKQGERDAAALAVMHKLYDRFVGPRRGSRG